MRPLLAVDGAHVGDDPRARPPRIGPLASVVLAACVGACAGGDEADRTVLSQPDGAGAGEVASTCGGGEPLRAALGQGEVELELLLPGQAPRFHRGIQSGRHLFLGVRIENPDRDHPGFEATFSHLHAGERDFRPFWLLEGLRDGPAGSLQQTGLILITDVEPEGEPGLLELHLNDGCGRRTLVSHPFEYAPDE